MINEMRISQVLNNNPQEVNKEYNQKKRWWNCEQTGINKHKVKIGNRGQTTELTGRNT